MSLIFIYKRANMNCTSLFWDDPKDIMRLTQILKNNNICIGSSDTVIGLMAPLTVQGYNKLNMIKKRSQKPYVVLVGSLDRVNDFAYVPQEGYIQTLLEEYWPGPLTVVLQLKNDKLKLLQSENNTVAIRIPQHAGLLQLLQNIDGIFSTSANKAGDPIPRNMHEVDPDIQDAVACTIIERDVQENILPSTIIDCSQGQLRLIREGAISFVELSKKAEQFKNNNS